MLRVGQRQGQDDACTSAVCTGGLVPDRAAMRLYDAAGDGKAAGESTP
jgi:hypothetical protein